MLILYMKKEEKMVACEICGKTFLYRKKKRFCSSTCRHEAFMKRLFEHHVKKEQTLQKKNETLHEENKTLQDEKKAYQERFDERLRKAGYEECALCKEKYVVNYYTRWDDDEWCMWNEGKCKYGNKQPEKRL